MSARITEAMLRAFFAELKNRNAPLPFTEDARAALAAALSTEPGEAERWQPTHRHKKRGTTYRLDGYGELQTAAPIGDYAKVAIYRAEDGKTWVRPVSEFNDGRFEALPATPLPEDTRHGR